uniref:Protein split ends n=1 Tax=Cacopsylla melanoneura TaxID=428564 RepID=A0A8D8SFH5_9HEMI
MGPQPQPLVTKFTMTSTQQPLIGKVIAVSSSLQAQPTLSIFTTVSSPSQAHTIMSKFTNVSSPQQAQTTITKLNTVAVPFQSSQPQPTLAKFVTAIHQPTSAKITPGLPQPNFTKYATITSVMPHHSVPKLPQVSPMTVHPQPSMAKFTTVAQPTIAKIPVVTTPQPQPQPINPKAHLLNRITKAQAPLTPKAIILQSIANGPTLEAPVPLKPGGTPSPNLSTAAPRSVPMEVDTPRPLPYEASSMNEVIPGYQHTTPGSHYVHPSVGMYHQSMYHHLREAALAQQQGGYHTSGSGQDKDSADVVPPVVGSSPHERTTDSPQVATLYTLGNRLLFHQPPPGFRPARHLTTPPHASPEPPLSTDTLYSVLERRYPVMWQGELVLKSDQAFVQMHYVFGNHLLARDALPLATAEGGLSPTPTFRFAQRMRLEQTQIDGVVRKMQTDGEHCMLLALPCGRTEVDVVQQSAYLQSGFITYLQQKQAAGIVNIAAPGTQQAAYIVHVFPSCEFANNSLAQIDAQLLKKVSELTYLVIIIATTATSATG